MKNLFISCFARSNVGRKRTNNEDNFYLSGVTVDSANDITANFPLSQRLATAVFDGMGGEAAGEVASQIAASIFGKKSEELINAGFSDKAINSTISLINNYVCNDMQKQGRRMGCTYVSLGFVDSMINIANVGDSRAYLLRDNKLICVSKDHTVAQSMVDAGIVSYEDSQKIKEKHKLTQHMGIFPEEMILEPYINSFEAHSDDVILLCSDGLTDMLSDSEIKAVLQLYETPENTANILVEKALENGGKDNVTVIVAKIENYASKAVSDKPKSMKLPIIGGIVTFLILGIIGGFLIADQLGFIDKVTVKLNEKFNSTTTTVTTAPDTTKKPIKGEIIQNPSTDDTDKNDLYTEKISKEYLKSNQ